MKYILVTGAYGGMGRAFIERAEKEGYTILALDICIPEGCREKNIIPIAGDITSGESIKRAYEEVKTITDTLYAIVHFGGIYMLNSLIEIDEKDYEKIFRVNVFGPYLVNKVFFPLLKENSRIVITTSELAPLKPLPFTGLYAITKSTLDNYAFSLYMEVQMKGIKVSVLRPGAVKTKMLGVSTRELDSFVKNTKIYNTNAVSFKRIVESVETNAVEPERIAEKVIKILKKKKPRFSYRINNNFLLSLTRITPGWLERYVVKRILK